MAYDKVLEEKIRTIEKSSSEMQREIDKLKKERDYWKDEAIKNIAKLGEVRIALG